MQQTFKIQEKILKIYIFTLYNIALSSNIRGFRHHVFSQISNFNNYEKYKYRSVTSRY